MAELQKARKIRNTYQILLKIVLFDTESIEGLVEVKISKNQRLLTEKQHFFPRILKIQRFWPKCQDHILATIKAEHRKPRKIRK